MEGGRADRPPRYGADQRARLALRALHARGTAPLDAGDDPGYESGEDVSVVSLVPSSTSSDPEIELLRGLRYVRYALTSLTTVGFAVYKSS